MAEAQPLRHDFASPAVNQSAATAMFAAGTVLSALPFVGVAYSLFGLSLAAYLPLYPIALLFLFRKKASGTPGILKSAGLLVPGMILTICGILLGRLSLIWIGSFWNFLAVCRVHGIAFAFPAPLLIFAAPPLSAFTSVVAGFSLRLWLTDLSARILAILDPAAHASGNVISFRGSSFAVDRVCEGMKMAIASFLIAAVLARFSSAKGRWLIALAVLLLWLAANLLRILSLVIFQIPAGTAGHELVGLILFLCVVLAPILFASLAFPSHNERAESDSRRPAQSRWIPAAAAGAFALLAAGFFTVDRSVEPRSWPHNFAGFRLEANSTRGDPRIAIYNRGNASVIFKQDLFAPGTAHDPRICFEAAGFSFGQESEERVGPFTVRSARVEKAGKPARLFWWYAWDTQRSASDVDWRLARMQGRRVTQWNLYGEDNEDLRNTASKLLGMDAPL
jgi:exosortase N